jgi:large subunit ribosomal protein L9
MKVVFIKALKGTGKLHDIKEVSDGYAQNFLIPKGYAVRATDNLITTIALDKKYNLENEQQHAQELRTLLETIKKTEKITISDHPHAKGRLYSAVTAQEICHAFHTQHQIFIQKNTLLDYEPIHETGEHEITIGDKKQSIIYRVSVV